MTQKEQTVTAIITNRSNNKILLNQRGKDDPAASLRGYFTLFETTLKPGESGETGMIRGISEEIFNSELPDFQPVHWRDFEYDDRICSVYTITLDDELFNELIEELVDDEDCVKSGIIEMCHTSLVLMMMQHGDCFLSRLNEILYSYLKSDLPETAWTFSWRCADTLDHDMFDGYFDIFLREEGLRFSFVGRVDTNHYGRNYSVKGGVSIDLTGTAPAFTLNADGDKPFTLTLAYNPQKGGLIEVTNSEGFIYVNYNYYYCEE